MKTRAGLFSIFQKFHVEIRTQFNTSICILRSDKAKEYFSTSLSSFMSSHEILRQPSCSYTPQHNGVTERKNRHLVETTRTILLHHKVPQRFWGDAILGVLYGSNIIKINNPKSTSEMEKITKVVRRILKRLKPAFPTPVSPFF